MTNEQPSPHAADMTKRTGMVPDGLKPRRGFLAASGLAALTAAVATAPAHADTGPAPTSGSSSDATQSRFMLDIVHDLGADPTGKTSCSTALSKGLDQLKEAGGTIYFPPGVFKLSEQITLPTLDDHLKIAPIQFQGSGRQDASTAGVDYWRQGGTILACEHNGQAQFVLRGRSRVVFRDLTFENTSDPKIKAPFLNFIESSFSVENCSFKGHDDLEFTKCIQDAIILGNPGDGDAIFAGYGSSIQNCNFDRIRRAITFLGGANGVMVQNIVITQQCGTGEDRGAALVFDAGDDNACANLVVNVVAECHAYPYLIKMQHNSVRNTFLNIQCWDYTWMDPKIFKKAFLMIDGAAQNNCYSLFLDAATGKEYISDTGNGSLFAGGILTVANRDSATKIYGTLAGPS